MSINDIIKRSFLESEVFTSVDWRKLVISLLMALILGCLIYMIYKRFYAGVIYSRSFAVTLVGMTVLTCMVTLAISTNVVISLGMVGALSIVRYRTAVKDPLDLLYLFWAITTGITCGAGMFVLAFASFAVMLIMLYVFYHRASRGAIYIMVVHYDGDASGGEILRKLSGIRHYVKSRTMRGETNEMAIEVMLKNDNLVFTEKIKELEQVRDVTLIQYNGEYHG